MIAPSWSLAVPVVPESGTAVSQARWKKRGKRRENEENTDGTAIACAVSFKVYGYVFSGCAFWIANAQEDARCDGARDCRARARHWREHFDFHFGECDFAAAAAVSGSGAACPAQAHSNARRGGAEHFWQWRGVERDGFF